MQRCSCLLLLAVVLGIPATTAGQLKTAEEEKDFPPGTFLGGQKVRLADLKGKLVVLYLYDGSWDQSTIFVREANTVVKKYKDQAVKFFAVAEKAPVTAAAAFARSLTMPIFVDNLGLLQKRFGQNVGGEKTVRFVLIGTSGLMVDNGMILESSGPKQILTREAAVQTALDKQSAEWKYNVKDYDAKLEPALKAFEWNQYEAGMKLLAPLRIAKTKKDKAVKESADKLYAEIKKEGEAWKEEADQAAEEKPVRAYDLYARVARLFPAKEELAKDVAAPLKKLKASSAVKKELEARKEMVKLEAQLALMSPAQRPQAIALCKGLAKRFPGTPTGDQAQALALELKE